jgi:hypothetical protein
LQSSDEKQVEGEKKENDRITVKEAGEFIITLDENRQTVLRSL